MITLDEYIDHLISIVDSEMEMEDSQPLTDNNRLGEIGLTNVLTKRDEYRIFK